MNLSLVRESDRTMSLERFDGRVLDPLHRQPGTLTCFEFLFQVLQRLVRRLKQVTVNSLEIALDLFGGGNSFHPIDRRAVALRRHSRPVFAVVFLDVVITVVERVHQVRRCPRCHPAADRAVVDHNHFLARSAQLVGDGQPRDACANNEDVAASVLAQRMERRFFRGRFPKRKVRAGPFFLMNCHKITSGKSKGNYETGHFVSRKKVPPREIDPSMTRRF